jgi:pyruvate/2-oxoglutarate dehydrogenase complex dihydrolipoamide dehydrogenase (E3) component
VEERRRRPHPGGTCTNVGCIPSKALLQSQRALRAGLAALRRAWHRREGVDAGRGARCWRARTPS